MDEEASVQEDPRARKCFLISSLNLSCQFVAINSCPPTMHRCEEPGFVLLVAPVSTGRLLSGPFSSPG